MLLPPKKKQKKFKIKYIKILSLSSLLRSSGTAFSSPFSLNTGWCDAATGRGDQNINFTSRFCLKWLYGFTLSVAAELFCSVH